MQNRLQFEDFLRFLFRFCSVTPGIKLFSLSNAAERSVNFTINEVWPTLANMFRNTEPWFSCRRH